MNSHSLSVSLSLLHLSPSFPFFPPLCVILFLSLFIPFIDFLGAKYYSLYEKFANLN